MTAVVAGIELLEMGAPVQLDKSQSQLKIGILTGASQHAIFWVKYDIDINLNCI